MSYGKTVGKFIVGTRVTNPDGTAPSGEAIVLRTFARLVPLDPLSALGSTCYPWHDSWAHVVVVDERSGQPAAGGGSPRRRV